jgi:protein SCO1/2
MRPSKLSVITLFIALVAVVSCSTNEKQESIDLVTFPLKGEVMEVDTVNLRVIIAHEEIPDYMAAMTMPFKVKDQALLQGISPGDSVLGTLSVSRTGSWLSAITVYGQTGSPDLLDLQGSTMQRMFQHGDLLPDVLLLDQEGNTVRLGNFRGSVLAITFVYTRCPLPEFCIRMSDNFARIQKALLGDPNISGQWHLVTVSFDPEFDKPGVMKSYGKSYGADFSRWTFLTDPDSSGKNVLRVAEGLGLVYEDDEGATITHNLRTVLVGRDGRIMEIIKDNEWKAAEVAEKMREMM